QPRSTRLLSSAASDVYKRQLFTHRNKHKLMALIDVPQMKPLVHVSGMFGAWRGNTSWVAPLAWHPENRNAVIMVDLAGDISPLLELDSDTLRERLYTAKTDLGDNAAVPVKLVHINNCLLYTSDAADES
ncbi:hypothetical protein KQJ25_36285, partial [Escherichia sp. S69_ASV_4]|nr:hypothetical protein [Escherichia sp. S69_ASV_4]